MDETTKEIQQNELAALRAIFMDDFKDVEAKTAWNVRQAAPEFVIQVQPTDNELKERVSVGLHVRLPMAYPRAVPQLNLESGFGLSEAQQQSALAMLKQQAESLVGGEMIYELAILLSEYITTTNSAAQVARPSFHQQMVEREQAGRQAILEREAELRRLQQQAYAEEQEELQRRIRAEVARKQQQLLSDEQRQRHLSDVTDAVHSVAGKWAEGIQLLKFEKPVLLDPQIARDGWFTTVALEESSISDSLCTVFDAYPTDLVGASTHLSDRFTVQCFTITALHYLTDQGRRQMDQIRARVADLSQIRHQNLVAVYGCHMDVYEERSQSPGICMWVLSDTLLAPDALTLEDVLESCGTMAVKQTRTYLRHILLALVSLHAAGFIHRNIMPKNILLAKEARGRFTAKLFNTSYREEMIELHRMTPLSASVGDAVGNEIRVAPEVVDRPDMMGRKNDLWCVGLTGLQMALGVEALQSVAIGKEPEVLVARRTEIAPALFGVLEMLLNSDHRQRPTAMEALNDPFFHQEIGGGPSVQHQALDSASRGLKFDLQRSARIANSTADIHDDTGPSAALPFFSVAQKNIAKGAAAADAAAPQRPSFLVPAREPKNNTRQPRDSQKKLAKVEHFLQPSASRYRTDFEEIEFLGKGGFGSVVKARNRIDSRFYAIKKIKLDARDTEGNKKIFREVTTLSRLHHQNVVRYYTTWVEDMDASMRMEGIPEEESEDTELLTNDNDEHMDVNLSHSSWSTEDEIHSRSSSSDSDSEYLTSGVSAIATGSAGDNGTLDTINPRADDDLLARPKGGRADNVFSAIRFGTMGAGAAADVAGRRKRVELPDGPVREFKIEFTGSQSDTTPEATDGDTSSSENGYGGRSRTSVDDLSDLLLRDQQKREQLLWYERENLPHGGLRSRSDSGDVEAATSASVRRKKHILYIQMEYCENKTLSDLIKEGLSEKECWRLFSQILEGLKHIHQCGVIHRDLKPVNAFLNGAGEIKIGDFGLATSNFAQIDSAMSRHMSLDRSAEDALTADIGTSTYVAPEVMAKSSGGTRYNQKVDMYSLGIIFFEMCYPMSTGMERANVLHNLRRAEIVFPEDFPTDKLQLQYQIIRRLLSHDPRLRPSSAELLESDLLPPKMEDEYIQETIRTIANPSQPYFARLMDSLFAHSADKHIDATFDYHSNDVQSEQLNAVFLDRIRELMTRVFRTHAAVELSTPALIPRTDLLGMYQRPALFVDPKGNVVQLPYDQTVPFARYVARTKMTEIKRYCFDRCFFANAAGGQPLSYSAASFDAVTNRSAHAVAAAEVISVACEVFDELPAFRTMSTVLMINHMCVLDAILAYCGILHPEWIVSAERRHGASSGQDAFCDDESSGTYEGFVRPEDRNRHTQYIRSLCFCLGSLYREKAQVVRQRIQIMGITMGMKVPSQALDRLQAFMSISGDITTVQREVLTRIGSECGVGGTPYAIRGAEYVHRAIRAFNELRYVEATVRHFGVVIPLVYAPLFNHHYSYYEGGYCFQIMTGRHLSKGSPPQVLAVGGRYDGLLRRFRHLAGSFALDDDGLDSSSGALSIDRIARTKSDASAAAPVKTASADALHEKSTEPLASGLSSMSFARRAGSLHSTDVWQQMFSTANASDERNIVDTRSTAVLSQSSSRSSSPPPGGVSIGTHLSHGSAALGTARDVVCIGVQIQLDLVIQEMARYQQQALSAAATSATPTFGLWTRKRCDVVVASFGTRPMLKQRIALSRELRANGLRTDFLFNDDPEMTMERLVEICRDQGMNWIVTLKRKPESGNVSGSKRRSVLSASIADGGEKGMLADEKYIFKVKNILRRVECEVSHQRLCEWLHTDINEQFKLDLRTHELRGGSGLVSNMSMSASSAAAMAAQEGSGGIRSIPSSALGNSGGITTGSEAGTSSASTTGAGRLEIVVVDPQQKAKNLNRTKHKQRMMLTDRAMSGVNRIMGEVKSAPVLVLDMGPELLKRLSGEASILSDSGYKRVMELSSAHQRAFIVELRSYLERYLREGSSYVWLYSTKGDFAVTYKL
ncbi:kinase-like protein [Coemansia reversa NRRL 1564]|uniref:non-specific serine/threonine protein kinase n=1 Tax=Coemansia reversa (strain ATCC 12441 / NRRL 1564) TaxID=763665 RepID=A0A2G5B8N2_COERN|nr:kinase-like protein [Coemansia reversa NRRL 1564]|eukprot:PIA15378.1 kinase-like protein [Coemansia reversa NRRL 1564]